MNITSTRTFSIKVQQRKVDRSWRIKRRLPLYIMFVPALAGLALFKFLPMFGLVAAFQDYKPLLGFIRSPFVGLAVFERLFAMPTFWHLIRNTLVISSGKIFFGQLASLIFALLLHEVTSDWFKGTLQTITYTLYFLSWILFGGILLDILGMEGIVNTVIKSAGLAPIPFLLNAKVFPFTLIFTDVWKNFGFGAVIYLAALTGVDPTLYEAAAVDGANRWQRMVHVTLPGIAPTIVVVVCLSLGLILNAGLEQVLVLYNSSVYSTGDIIDTFVYRVGIQSMQYSLGTAVGLLQSVVAFILISLAYYLAYRFADYRIF